MARLIIDGPDLVVGLSWLEKLGAFRGDVRVPLRAVRSPGTGVPGVIALGTRHYAGGRDFAALRGRGPAVRVDLDGQSTFARLVVSVRDTRSTVAAIHAATGV